jgi:hypothetical protein
MSSGAITVQIAVPVSLFVLTIRAVKIPLQKGFGTS